MKTKQDNRINIQSQEVVVDVLTSFAGEPAYEQFIEKEDFKALMDLLTPNINNYYAQQHTKMADGIALALKSKTPMNNLDDFVGKKTKEIIDTIVALKKNLAGIKKSELSGYKAVEALEQEARVLVCVKLLKSLLDLKPLKSDQHAVTITRATLQKYSKENFSPEVQTELYQEALQRSRSERENTDRLIRLNETDKSTIKSTLNSYESSAKAADAAQKNETEPSLQALNYLKRLVANEARAYAKEKFAENPPSKRHKS